MTQADILKRLKDLRSLTNSSPIIAVENNLDRLIRSIQQDEDELEKEWETLTSGRTLVNVESTLSYTLVRE